MHYFLNKVSQILICKCINECAIFTSKCNLITYCNIHYFFDNALPYSILTVWNRSKQPSQPLVICWESGSLVHCSSQIMINCLKGRIWGQVICMENISNCMNFDWSKTTLKVWDIFSFKLGKKNVAFNNSNTNIDE